MSNVFAHINVSIDGYINDDSGVIDWTLSDSAFEAQIDRTLESIDAMVFGRAAHDELSSYWPTAGEEVTAVQRERMHVLPKYVLSRTLTRSGWHETSILTGDLHDAFRELRDRHPRGIAVFAGGAAISSLLAADVLDELRLFVNPVLLGGGTRLFQGGYSRSDWSMTTAQPVGNGGAELCYRRIAADQE